MLWPMGAVSTALSRMSTVGFPWMSLDHSSLLAQASIRKPRRPVAEEMLSLRIRDDRPLVEVNQQPIRLPQMGDSLSLLWRWRSGGCLGPEAAVALNARQRQPGRTGPQQQTPPRWADRGSARMLGSGPAVVVTRCPMREETASGGSNVCSPCGLT